MSLASDIALELSNRAASVTQANGYATDVGTTVFRGKRSLDEGELPCVVILEGEDRVADASTKHVKLGQRYVLEAHATTADPDNPNDLAHEILADLKRALFASDRTLGRRARELNYIGRRIGAREDGSSAVFAAVEIEVVFSEDLTEP